MHYDNCSYELRIELMHSELGLMEKEAEEETNTY